MTAFLVPLDARIGKVEAEIFDLRHGLVDELLTQLIVGFDFDLPGHRLFRVGRIRIRRAEHHYGWEPEAVDRVLGLFLLFGCPKGHFMIA